MTEESSDLKFNYFFGLINLVAVFVIVWFLWYVFMNPDAVMKLYTPMYGFALVAVFVSGIILMENVIECSTLYHRIVKSENPIVKGRHSNHYRVSFDAGAQLHCFLGLSGKAGDRVF